MVGGAPFQCRGDRSDEECRWQGKTKAGVSRRAGPYVASDTATRRTSRPAQILLLLPCVVRLHDCLLCRFGPVETAGIPSRGAAMGARRSVRARGIHLVAADRTEWPLPLRRRRRSVRRYLHGPVV